MGLVAQDDAAQVTIVDDGQGFDLGEAASNGQGFGLRFMHERVAEVGGSLQVRSAPGQGTEVVVQVPLRKDKGP